MRLQDVNLSYDFGESLRSRTRVQSFRLFLNCTNLGILWRANKEGIDPDYPAASYPVMLTVTLGVKIVTK